MSLPFEYTIVPIITCDSLYPPYVPQLQGIPYEVTNIIPQVSSEVINTAGRKAHIHQGRTLCYNTIVNNNCQNEQFAEIVKLALGLIYLNLQKKLYRSSVDGIVDAVDQILTGYTSNLILTIPELKGAVDSRISSGAYHNADIFNKLKQEITSMYNNQPQNQQPGFPGNNNGMPNQQQQPQYPQQFPNQQPQYPQHYTNQQPQFPQQFPTQPMYPQQYPQYPVDPRMMPQQGYPMDPRMMPQGFPTDPRMMPPGYYPPPNNSPSAFGSSAPGSAFGSSFGDNSNPGQGNQGGVNISQDRFTRKAANIQNNNANQSVPVEVPLQTISVVKKQTHLLIDNPTNPESEMDRAQHQITFFGNTYKAENVVKYKQYAHAVEVLDKPAVIEDDVSNNISVHPSIILSVNLDSAIADGHAKHLMIQNGDSDTNIFRCFSAVLRPFISRQLTNNFANKLRDTISFIMLINKMKTIASSLESDVDSLQATATINFLSFFDNVITEIINDFLSNKLGMTLKIDSFVEDHADLIDCLSSNTDHRYFQAFSKFEEDVINTVLEKIFQDDSEDDAIELVKVKLGLNNDVMFTLIPVNCSFTYTFMNNKELGYVIGDKPVIISRENAPLLFKIAKSLQQHKRDIQMTTIYDYLVTADDVRYRLYKSYFDDNTFMISKA